MPAANITVHHTSQNIRLTQAGELQRSNNECLIFAYVHSTDYRLQDNRRGMDPPTCNQGVDVLMNSTAQINANF